VAAGARKNKSLPSQAMSEEQLSALLAKLKDDAGLQEKLQGAADLDALPATAPPPPSQRETSPVWSASWP